MLSKIIHLVQNAKNEKPPSQQFVGKFEGIYAKAVVIGAILFVLFPPFLLGWAWHDTIYRAMIFLVVASPCALVSSIMPAILSGISNAARNGVLFKGGVHLQNIADVKVAAFDKTGTITIGRPKVIDVIPMQGMTEPDFLQLTASVESLSEHPIAKAIVEEAIEKGLKLERPVGLQENCDLYCLGRLSYWRFNYTGQYQAWAKKIISELKKMGIKVALLTGDTYTVANAIAKQAGIDEIYAELLPEHKAGIVKQLENTYGKVAMIGDGVNDAPALATASIGIAIGTGGTDVAMETADIILIKDNIENLPFAIKLGKEPKK